jgi:hypothetical protein
MKLFRYRRHKTMTSPDTPENPLTNRHQTEATTVKRSMRLSQILLAAFALPNLSHP